MRCYDKGKGKPVMVLCGEISEMYPPKHEVAQPLPLLLLTNKLNNNFIDGWQFDVGY